MALLRGCIFITDSPTDALLLKEAVTQLQLAVQTASIDDFKAEDGGGRLRSYPGVDVERPVNPPREGPFHCLLTATHQRCGA